MLAFTSLFLTNHKALWGAGGDMLPTLYILKFSINCFIIVYIFIICFLFVLFDIISQIKLRFCLFAVLLFLLSLLVSIRKTCRRNRTNHTNYNH